MKRFKAIDKDDKLCAMDEDVKDTILSIFEDIDNITHSLCEGEKTHEILKLPESVCNEKNMWFIIKYLQINSLIYDRLACMSEDNCIQYFIRDPMLFPVSCSADEC